jgi:nicotinamide-nucleotide amidase
MAEEALFDQTVLDLARSVLQRCRQLQMRLVTAESCTGGLIAGCLTAVPGASDVFDRGYVTYSNAAKTALLRVPTDLLARTGAVDEQVARAMAEGALQESGTDVAVAVTGIAGPDGGSVQKPVGLVHFAAARRAAATLHERHVFPGDRDAVRAATVATALHLLARRLA